ncbi:MAG TPA: hypothetical protein VN693_08805 [Rhodanobacteraceae bacterium]|nr:hypothetical protein [Rhodanobacteraceae bacterium]
MNLSPLVLPLTVATTALVFVLINKIRTRASEVKAERNIYGYSVGVQYFCFVGALLFAILPYGFYFSGVEIPVWQWSACAILCCFELIIVIYAKKYSVELSSEYLTCGAFVKKTLRYVDINSIHSFVSTQGNAYCALRTADSKVTLSGNIQNFASLVNKLKESVRAANPFAVID